MYPVRLLTDSFIICKTIESSVNRRSWVWSNIRFPDTLIFGTFKEWVQEPEWIAFRKPCYKRSKRIKKGCLPFSCMGNPKISVGLRKYGPLLEASCTRFSFFFLRLLLWIHISHNIKLTCKLVLIVETTSLTRDIITCVQIRTRIGWPAINWTRMPGGECPQAHGRVGVVKCTSLVGQKFAITLVCPQMSFSFIFLYFFSSFSINPGPPARIEPLSARPAVIDLRFVSKPFCDWLFWS